ncbi:Hypothetical protein NCS54_01473500 [Fusarium falciforme]|uniref:Hypothetical protein n=1 Tax=Fusarium falciforme TaxID=195108 RepID=UPI002301120B|nr:Hypothetical protein NCS54_01473500 [Fusarium falciforme]WAO97031.1 Hypothetical protein NCS54_01473500 [Fusarium falciforme]
MKANDVPELLYRTVLTLIDYHEDPWGATRSVYVLGTHNALKAAKAFATSALQGLNYEPDGFTEYAVRSSEPWEHGDGVLVFARAPAGQEFLIEIDTTLNNESLLASPDGTVVIPQGSDRLHYVLQTTIDYNLDRTCSVPSTKIQGTVRESEEIANEWPFGEGMVAHAVPKTRPNYVMTVRTVPGTHKRHGKKVKQ